MTEVVITNSEECGMDCWYYGLVGEVFDVTDYGDHYVLTRDRQGGNWRKWRRIEKADCKVLSN